MAAIPLLPVSAREAAMSFALYIIGFLVFIGGVAWALTTAHVPTLYIVIACMILLGLGIMAAVSKTRTRDSS